MFLSVRARAPVQVSNNAAAKGALWRAVHTHLLPVCERALTDIARVAKPLLTQSSTAGTGANSGAVQQSAQYPRDLCAALETTCQVRVTAHRRVAQSYIYMYTVSCSCSWCVVRMCESTRDPHHDVALEPPLL